MAKLPWYLKSNAKGDIIYLTKLGRIYLTIKRYYLLTEREFFIWLSGKK